MDNTAPQAQPAFGYAPPQIDPAYAAYPQGYQPVAQSAPQAQAIPDNSTSKSVPQVPDIPPPIGSSEEADRYLAVLTELISQKRLTLTHTDLNQFDPTTLQDHYRVDLNSYEIEVSHSKQPDTDKDFYVMLFNNLKKIQDVCTHKVILAYIHLNAEQFKKFKIVADEYIERKKVEAEKERFEKAMVPIDDMLKALSGEDEAIQPKPQIEEPEDDEPVVEKAASQPAPIISEPVPVKLEPTPLSPIPAQPASPDGIGQGRPASMWPAPAKGALPITNVGVTMPVEEVVDDVNTANNPDDTAVQEAPSDFISQMYNGSALNSPQTPNNQNQVVV